MAMDGILPTLLGFVLLLVNFVIGFVLAKYFSMRRIPAGRAAACLCLLIAAQSLLFTVTTTHFWLGVFFTWIGSRLLVPGLTGGLASGKTTVSCYLKNCGWDVIEADEISRSVLKRGAPAFYQVVEAFGESIIEAHSGEIDRTKVREIVFQDASKRRLLNKLTHPRIIASMIWQVFKLRICLWRPRVILDIPLLFETRLNFFCGPVAVVYVAEELQLSRLFKRDRACSEQTLRSMVCSQRPLNEKAALADIVLDNNSTLDHLFRQTRQHFPC